MSEMKQVADVRPDEANKVFSHLEEKQQLDLSDRKTINDGLAVRPGENILIY